MEPMKNQAPDISLDTRNRLILAAVQIFAAKSFEGASIREIARLANANSALIQYHFGGKEGLYLEAVKFVFRLGDERMQNIPPAPDPSIPKAREEAIRAITAQIRSMVGIACLTSKRVNELYGAEIQKASFTLWNQALQTLRPHVLEFVREATSPRLQHLHACISVLRPDLSEEGLFRMELSILSQPIHLHNHMEMVKLHRGAPYNEADLDSLADHYTQFSLRGLGIQEAFPTLSA